MSASISGSFEHLKWRRSWKRTSKLPHTINGWGGLVWIWWRHSTHRLHKFAWTRGVPISALRMSLSTSTRWTNSLLRVGRLIWSVTFSWMSAGLRRAMFIASSQVGDNKYRALIAWLTYLAQGSEDIMVSNRSLWIGLGWHTVCCKYIRRSLRISNVKMSWTCFIKS